jgi:predicted CXXCH cytochrome family protein
VAGVLVFVAGGLLSITLIGCAADPQKRYEVLSFFFDGVPDPNAPKKQSTKVSSGRQRTFVHKPFADNLCSSCHLNTTDIFARAQVKGDVCLNCHSNVPTQYAVMHGPVVNNACQMCHSPHSSAVPHLLKQPAPAVCTQCHEPQTMTLMHKQPLDPKQSCIDCHSGHGGSDHKLLLATPATRPAILQGSEVPR